MEQFSARMKWAILSIWIEQDIGREPLRIFRVQLGKQDPRVQLFCKMHSTIEHASLKLRSEEARRMYVENVPGGVQFNKCKSKEMLN
jgi:hypothetical protein